jgi:Replication initiator protein, pSAM2
MASRRRSSHRGSLATLTAPSFGPVHAHRTGPDGEPAPCRPRREHPVCPHGRPQWCSVGHESEEECVGEPLCPECFDYEAAVTWNNTLGRLWRYTTIYLPRRLAATLGITQAQLKREVRISYLKVAEYQRRGLVHLHVLMRLDRHMPPERADEHHPPAPRYTAALLEQALRDTVATVACPAPKDLGGGAVRWGSQLDVQLLEGRQKQVAGYLAKYATKSTEHAGGTAHRITFGELDRLRMREHPRRLVQTVFQLHERNREVRLARCAHQNGYRGHCLTKSRRYSTTLTALRQARELWIHERLAHHGRPQLAPGERVARYRYRGIGHVTAADVHLAAKAAIQTRQLRQRDRSRPPDGRTWPPATHDRSEQPKDGAG